MIKKLLFRLWLFFFPGMIKKQINKQAAAQLVYDDKRRKELLIEIRLFLKNNFDIDAKSEFIPYKVRKEAVDKIHANFRDRMKAQRITVTNNLVFKLI